MLHCNLSCKNVGSFGRIYGASFRKKLNIFLRTKYFFDASSSCFCRHEILFSATSIFFVVDMKHFLVNHHHEFADTRYLLHNVKLFVSTQNYCSCNTKFLFWTSFRMLCHSDILLLSHSNKNIITCQKLNKISFLCDTKKFISFFVHHIFFIFSFTLHIGSMLIFFVVVLETKKLLIHLLLT